jgi:hypothetical protein
MEGDARGDRRSRRIQTIIDRVGSHPVDWQAGSEKGCLLWGREKKIKGNGQVVFMCECSLLMGKERGEQTEVESSSGLYRTAHY